MTKTNPLKLLLVICALFMILGKETQAQSSFHFSAAAATNPIDGYFPGVDYTLLMFEQYGFRYSMLPKVRFVAEEVNSKGGTLSTYKLEGDYTSMMLLRTIDYRNFSMDHKGPFQFLTAYTGVGYNEIKPVLTHQSFSASGSNLISTVSTEELPVKLYSVAFGLYGGESFLVIDSRLLYFRGESEQSPLLGEKVTFNQWMILFALGIGF